MGSQHLSAGGEDNVSSGVMSLKLPPSLEVDDDVDLLALAGEIDFFVEDVENALSDLDGVDDIVDLLASLKLEHSIVVLLPSRGGVDSRSVEDDNVVLVLLKHVAENFYNLCIEVHDGVVLVVDVLGLGDVRGVVEDVLGGLGRALLPDRDLVVEVLGHGRLDHLGDLVGGDAVRLHAHDPVVDGELALALLDDLLELLDGLVVGVAPAVVLDLDDLAEALVLGELAVDALQVLLVHLEDLQEALHAELLPPAVLLEDAEHAAQDVAHVAAAAHVGGQGAVGDGDEDGARVVEDDVEVLDGLDGLLDGLDLDADGVGDLLPGVLDVVDLVDVERAGVGPELGPDLLLDLHLQPLEHEAQRRREGVLVGGGAPVNQPGHALEADAHVDDLDVELLTRAVVEGLVLHEDHVAHLEAAHEVLDGGAEVAAAGPDVLDEGDLLGGDVEGLGQPAEVELDGLVLEELVVVGVVEDLDAQHDEARVVPPRDPDVVQVVEARRELGADQRVRRRVQLPRHAVGLEAVDARRHEVHVVPPAGHDGVALDGRAGDARGGEAFAEALPGLGEGGLLAVLVEAVADEGVLAVAVRVSARLALLRAAPVVVLALGALRPREAQLGEGLHGVELLGVGRELGLREGLDLLGGQALHCLFLFCHGLVKYV
mmetsp:Transcript_400/g.786  ORF Transcript_400/g.786 Transcript_400/m.786 type:complete len:656 (-) Transcript_400:41-2008(-)